ncbi:MAG: alpha-amylase family glycosyl hydrolase [Lachnospiraceae bacterium]
MAKITKKELRNLMMYSIYVRNHSEKGTFREVEKDIERIKDLGVDIIWLLPIHPIGEVRRKGTLGSPYAIKNYREINPEYGTIEDFKGLVNTIHDKGMKCMIDVVYNHTSPDSWLVKNHLEYFRKFPDGALRSNNDDWDDIADLDYSNKELWVYQIDTLKMWAEIVDGFRCDVAPLLPLDFWLEARQEVKKVKPDCLWLSESVEPAYILENRSRQRICLSDAEILQAFDICYDYDVYEEFIAFLQGKKPLQQYINKLNMQEYIYPDNYVKLRFLENHDRDRAKYLLPEEQALKNWNAFNFFQKGMTLIYAGQEMEDINRPDLFRKDPVNWEGHDLSDQIKQLSRIKKKPIMAYGQYKVELQFGHLIKAMYQHGKQELVGFFDVYGEHCITEAGIPDGIYRNELNGENIYVKNNKFPFLGDPVILEVSYEGAVNHDLQV